MTAASRFSAWRWAARDYVARLWDNARDNNILFLASGIAFDVLLASVPFVITLVSGVSYVLGLSTATSSAEVTALLDRMLPPQSAALRLPVHRIVDDALNANHSVGLWSFLIFILLSTRLFASLRTVLADVFDIDTTRGLIGGKLFDVKMTLLATVLFGANTILSAYLAVARVRGIDLLGQLGLRQDVMGSLEYTLGRIVAFLFLALMFFAIYRYLPARRVRWQTAAVASTFTSVLFEVARQLFSILVRHYNPGSAYTGALAAIIVVVVWVYYSAIVFILGGEVGQVFELRRTRRRQREVFTQ
ncbi:MAG TPA: YihY/virulence factor BrkB family protein [Gemmatimonadaceae bacterium]|jgi:membrane protein|nr:YihY/virulence factor BrkB family protein [Gemmatimonadaceae bacterium]